MKKNLTLVLAVLLMASLLFGCAAKPKEHTSTPAPAPAPTAPPAATQDEAPSKAPVDEPVEEEAEELPEELQQSQEVTTSNAQDWIELLCAHPWQAIDDLPDGSQWLSVYTFNADGTFTYFGGWNNSEGDADFAGTYAVSEDGILTLTYIEGHQAELTYELGFQIDTIIFTQIGDEGLMTFHKAGQTTTLSAA